MNADSSLIDQAGVQAAWSRDSREVLAELAVDPAQGLTAESARERQQQYGPNELQAAMPRRIIAIAADQFRGIVILLLTAAGTRAILFSEFAEGLAIFAVIAINGTIGFLTE